MKGLLQKITLAITSIAILIIANCGYLYAEEIHIAIIDSGAKGFVDNAVSFTSYPANSDPLNHGTQVAKLIRRDNPKVKITMLQVCDYINETLKPSRKAVLKAIRWAIENNVDIVNMSLVVKYDEEIEKAIADASTSHGVVFVAAAGNKTIASRFAADSDGYIRRRSSPIKPAFPASCEHVISVGAIDEYGQITKYSDKTCDVYVIGEILGQEGTSFASARITAKVAKIVSELKFTEIPAILLHLKS